MFNRNKRKTSATASAPLVKKASSSAINQYAGALDAAPIELAGECPSDLSAHVASRTPVHMRSLPANWRNKSAADLIAQLRRRADCSKVSVRVELRDDAKGQFGLGREAQWSLSDALDRIESGDERVYLSAQPLGEQCDGLAALAASPMAELLRSGEFECRPSLLSALVPANVNLWLGFARSGASSGLHHDFHDNLYVLLAGEKEFLLVNPSYAERMYTYGQIARVHPNGIINYADALTRADGATPFQVRRFEHRVKLRSLEKAIDAAEEDLAKGVRGAKQRLAKAQRALIALAPLANDDSDGDGDANDDDDDDDDNDGGLFGGADNDAAFDAHEDDDSFDDAAAFGGSQHDDFDEVEAEEAAAAATEQQPATSGSSAGTNTAAEMPPSFSRIADPEKFDAKQFPQFVGVPVHRVSLKAGEMLYLPAGWFHCVKSSGGLHCAVNYWFNVPPYVDRLFEDEWQERVDSDEVAH